MWVKICGITSPEDAGVAAAAGADAIGFVFAESPRRVTPEAVRRITDSLPAPVEKIGVFVNATLETVLHTVEQAGLTGVQLHGEDPSGIADLVREPGKRIAGKFRIVHVLHYARNPERFASQLRRLTEDHGAATVLVDTALAGRPGGTGIAFDWKEAEPSFRSAAKDVQMIAAGGLNPENVMRAIETLQPWGVDVSSGVEFAPGRKHPERVEAFVRAARAAVLLPGEVSAGMQK